MAHPNSPAYAEEYSRMWQQLSAILAHIDVYKKGIRYKNAIERGEAVVPEELREQMVQAVEESRKTLARVIGNACANESLNNYLGIGSAEVELIMNGGEIPEPFLRRFEEEMKSFRDNLAYYVSSQLAS